MSVFMANVSPFHYFLFFENVTVLDACSVFLYSLSLYGDGLDGQERGIEKRKWLHRKGVDARETDSILIHVYCFFKIFTNM